MFEPCPCGSGGAYLGCCARLHSGQAEADTAEQLMRARYSAYVKRDAAYLLKSWAPETRPIDLGLGEGREWLGLTVESAKDISADRAVVTFTARYRERGETRRLRERSGFRREGGLWVYVNGKTS